jgi:membrane glycosyltransferase
MKAILVAVAIAAGIAIGIIAQAALPTEAHDQTLQARVEQLETRLHQQESRTAFNICLHYWMGGNKTRWSRAYEICNETYQSWANIPEWKE